jgi:hypothetical protein
MTTVLLWILIAYAVVLAALIAVQLGRKWHCRSSSPHPEKNQTRESFDNRVYSCPGSSYIKKYSNAVPAGNGGNCIASISQENLKNFMTGLIDELKTKNNEQNIDSKQKESLGDTLKNYENVKNNMEWLTSNVNEFINMLQTSKDAAMCIKTAMETVLDVFLPVCNRDEVVNYCVGFLKKQEAANTLSPCCLPKKLCQEFEKTMIGKFDTNAKTNLKPLVSKFCEAINSSSGECSS